MRATKKIALCMGLLASYMLCGSAKADSLSAQMLLKGNTLQISVQTAPEETVTLTLMKYGETYQGFSNTFGVREGKSNADGTLVFRLTIPDERGLQATDGRYTWRVKGLSGAARDDFYFTSQPTREDLFGTMAGKDAAALCAQLDMPETRSQFAGAGFDMDAYDALTEPRRQEVCGILSRTTDFLGATLGVTSGFNNALATVLINYSDAPSEVVDAYGAYLELSLGELTYEDSAPEQKAWFEQVLLYNRPCEDRNDVNGLFGQALALYALNHAQYGEVVGLLAKHAGILGLTGDGNYAKLLTSAKKNQMIDHLVRSLRSTPAKSSAALGAVIKSAADTYAAPDDNSGGNGGGNGGGGTGRTVAVATELPGQSTAEQPQGEPFSDLGGDLWAKEAILSLAGQGVLSGYPGGVFRPGGSITKEEFVKIVSGAFALPQTEGAAEFEDVSAEVWAYPYISRAVASGIIRGKSDTIFGYGEPLTREDMAVILCRLILTKGVQPGETAAEGAFADEADISGYAKESVDFLRTCGILQGTQDGAVNPKAYCTRAECAVIIYRLLNLKGMV